MIELAFEDVVQHAGDLISVSSTGPGFSAVPHQLQDDPRITDPTTLAVYLALSYFVSYDAAAACWPSLAKIGQKARCGWQTAARHISLLIEYGYITKISRPGHQNLYHLVDAWGRRPQSPVKGGSVTSERRVLSQMKDERDSMNETQEGERARTRASAPEPAPANEPDLPFSPAPLPFQDRLQAVTRQALGSETAFAAKAESLLLRGEDADQILQAWEIMLRERPAGAAYFDKDYATGWKPKTKKRVKEPIPFAARPPLPPADEETPWPVESIEEQAQRDTAFAREVLQPRLAGQKATIAIDGKT